MSAEKIEKVLANVAQSLTSTEQAQARSNIGAQAALTAGDGINITNNVISATGLSGVSTTPPIYGDGTAENPVILRTSHGLSLVQSSDDHIWRLQVTHPVPAPGSTSTNKVLTCTDSIGNLDWRDAPTGTQVNSVASSSQGPITTPISAMNINGAGAVTLDGSSAGFLLQTGAGSATVPVYIDGTINEAVACDKSGFEGSRLELVMASSVTLDGTSNEQDWAIGAQHGWPYGWSSYRFEWNGIVTSTQNLTVRFYERVFNYNGVDGSFTPDAEKLLATAYLRSGTDSVNVSFTTEGWPNRKWLSGLHVTVQPDSAVSGSVTLSEQAGSYTAVNSGAEIITTPNSQPSGPWTPPNP